MKMQTEKTSRILWIDVAKGITIILVVLGHSSLPSTISRFIWAFHMPVFFLVSGGATNWKKYTFFKFLLRRMKTLVLPFCIYSIVLGSILAIDTRSCDIIWRVLKNGWGGYALWFIPVLFVACIIVKGVYLIGSRIGIWLLNIMLLCTAGTLDYFKILLPWNISTVFFASFLIIMGSELKCIYPKLERTNTIVFYMAIFLTLGISHYWRLDMCSNEVMPILPITIAAFSGSLVVVILSIWIVKNVPLGSNILQHIGRETFVIVAFSQVIIILLNKYVTSNVLVKYGLLVITIILITLLKNRIKTIISLVPVSKGHQCLKNIDL